MIIFFHKNRLVRFTVVNGLAAKPWLLRKVGVGFWRVDQYSKQTALVQPFFLLVDLLDYFFLMLVIGQLESAHSTFYGGVLGEPVDSIVLVSTAGTHAPCAASHFNYKIIITSKSLDLLGFTQNRPSGLD